MIKKKKKIVIKNSRFKYHAEQSILSLEPGYAYSWYICILS